MNELVQKFYDAETALTSATEGADLDVLTKAYEDAWAALPEEEQQKIQAERAPKPEEEAKKEKKEVKPAAPKDQFGNRVGTINAAINSVMVRCHQPVSMKFILEVVAREGGPGTGLKQYNHLKWLVDKSYAVKTAAGRFMLKQDYLIEPALEIVEIKAAPKPKKKETETPAVKPEPVVEETPPPVAEETPPVQEEPKSEEKPAKKPGKSKKIKVVVKPTAKPAASAEVKAQDAA